MDFAEIRRRTIVALFSDDTLYDQLVLKGGNAISLVYRHGNRASLDLDFSIENDFTDLEGTQRHIFGALERKFGEVGFTIFDQKFGPRPDRERPAASPKWGGYQLEFKLIEKAKEAKLGKNLEGMRRDALVVGPNQLRCFTVDLSKYEYCAGKVEKELDDYTIYVYTPEMLALEKLRAICQQMESYQSNPNKRPRPRDFYDIHVLVTAEAIDLTAEGNLLTLRHIFQAKDVPLGLLGRMRDDYDLHRLEWPSVRDTVAGRIEEFDFYFEFVLNEVARLLHALGDV